jgi:hypothetical protein
MHASTASGETSNGSRIIERIRDFLTCGSRTPNRPKIFRAANSAEHPLELGWNARDSIRLDL